MSAESENAKRIAKLKSDINNVVHSLYVEGLLDPQYGEVQALQDESTPHCMSTVINVYCANAERMINQMSGILLSPEVDYEKFKPYIIQLKGSSARFGARCIKDGCTDLQKACDGRNRTKCMRILAKMMTTYMTMENKLHKIHQMEQRICEFLRGQNIEIPM